MVVLGGSAVSYERLHRAGPRSACAVQGSGAGEILGQLGLRGTGVNQLLHRNVQRFRGGLVFKAHRHLYHSTLGLRVIKKKKKLADFS